MDLRKRNLEELTMAEELTQKVSEKINNGMTLLGTLVGGVNGWTQVYYFYNSDKKSVLSSQDENGEMFYDVEFLIFTEEQFHIRSEDKGIIIRGVKKYSLFEGVLNNHDVTTGYPEHLLEYDTVNKIKELYYSNNKIYPSIEKLKEEHNKNSQ